MPTENQETTATPVTGRRLALVVGVNGQPVPWRPALEYATADARDMGDTLQEPYCGFTLFRPTLLGEQATTAQVRNAVLDLAEDLHEGDFALFYFSGHGAAMLTEGGLDDVYLVTHDFNAAHLKRDKNAHLSLRWLRQMLFEHDLASQVLIILDCCYGGDFGGTAPDLYLNELLQRLKTYFDGPSAASPSRSGGIRLALTAAGPQRTALEVNGHGLMTGLLLPALNGLCEQAANEAGEVTFTRLFGYLDTTMPPERRPLFSGTGRDLLLATHPGLSQRAQREREQEAQRAERKQQLRAMSADHSGILHDRLDSFVGRAKDLAELRRHMDELLPTGGYLTIRGQAGQGKSSIIAKLIEAYSQEQGGLEQVAYHFIPLTPGPDHQVTLLRKLAARLVLKYDLSDLFLVGESRAALSDAFPRILKEISDKGGREFIFLDGLDQLETEYTGQRDLSFLPQGPGNPPNGIVFILGTRPDDTLHPLDLLKPHLPYDLPNLSRDDFDLILRHRHVTILERVLADRFYHALEENALYLDLVAKELALRGPITPAQVEEIIRELADNPETLFSLATYRLSLQQELWQTVIKPILGLLLATSEPLARQQLKQLINLNSTHPIDGDQLSRGLERLGGLVVSDGQQRYTLFHLKFRDYLREDAQRPGKRYLFDAQDERDWHRRFIAWCEQSELEGIWQNTTDTVEQRRRSYARQHYITHLYHAHLWERLFTILDAGAYGKAKVQHDPSTRTFALDLDLGRAAAASPEWSLQEALSHLPHLWRYTLLRCSVASRADRYPLESFRMMFLLGQESKALGLAELVTNPQRKAKIFTLLTSHLASQPGREREAAQLFLQAERFITSIASEWQRAEALTALVASLAQAHRWQEAERVIAFIASEWQRAEALTALAFSLAQAQRWQEAERLWQETERIIASIASEDQRAMALTALASSLAQAHRWQEGEHLWQETERVIASIASEDQRAEALTALASSLAQAQRWQEAAHLWQETERVIASITDEWQRAEALTALASSLAQAQRWQEAERLWQETERVIASIAEEWQRAEALTALASSLAQVQRWQEAEGVTASIADKWQRAEALTALASSLAQAQRWQEAERVIASIASEWQRAMALTALAFSLAQAQRWQEAERLWQETERIIASIASEDQRAMALTALASSLAQAHRWQEGEHLWQETERVIASIASEWQRAMALTALASSLAQAHRWQEAAHLWQEAEGVIASIASEWQRAEALTALASSLAQAHRWQEAERVIASIASEWQRAEALTALASSLAQAQRWQEAERLWQETEGVIASIASEDQRAEALTALASSLAQAQHWQEAEGVIASIADKWQRAEALTALASSLAQAQHWQEAEGVIASIASEDQRAEALTALASSLAQAHRWQEAERLWQEIERVIGFIADEWQRAEALTALASSLAQAQRWQEAERLWQETERVIASIADEWQRAEALTTLASSLAQAQRWQEAECAIASIADEARRAGALTALASSLAQAQRWQEAERVIASIADEDQRAQPLSSLAASLAQHNQHKEVVRLVQCWWQRVGTRDEATRLLPIASSLILLRPDIGMAFHDALVWVDDFLRG